MRIRDSIAAKRVSVTGEFCVNLCPALSGRIPRFKNEKSGPLAEHEAIPGEVERPTRTLGRIIVR
jgi:hypothetical protein